MGEGVWQHGMDRWGITTHLGNDHLFFLPPFVPLYIHLSSIFCASISPLLSISLCWLSVTPSVLLGAANCTSCTPPASPLCHRMPIVAGAHWKRSMARVAKQLRAELAAGIWRLWSMRGTFACCLCILKGLPHMHHTPCIIFSWSVSFGKKHM